MELLNAIQQYGILVIIAGVFIWDKVINSKNVTSVLGKLENMLSLSSQTLETVSHSIINTTTALSIMQSSLTNISDNIERHDTRAEYMNNDIRAILSILKITQLQGETISEQKGSKSNV